MNILVIRMHRFGDILQLTPMLQGLKEKYPDCRITFFTSSEMSDLLTDNPDVDEIISIPEKKYRYFLKYKPEYYARIHNEMYDLISDLKQRNFQMIINRHYEFGGILAYLIGAENICGNIFSPECGSFLNDRISAQLYEAVLTNRKSNRRNLVDWSFHIAGLPSGSGKMFFPVPEIDLWAAEHLLSRYDAQNDSPIAVQVGAAQSFRQWGADNYAHIIQWLIEMKGKRVVLLGTEDEKSQVDRILSLIGKYDNHIIDLIGKTDFKTLAGILKKCQKLITGDTGTMHMASAVGTQVVALFYGTAFPWETAPYGTGNLVLYADENCSPCFHPEDCISDHSCRKAITPTHVCKAFEIFEAIEENRLTDIDYPSEKVKLYVTLARSGADQILVPVNEISSIDNFFSVFIHSKTAERKGEGIAGNMNNLRKKGSHLLQKLHRGDNEGFMDILPGYVDQWIKVISYIKEKPLDKNVSESLIQCLYPAINETARAMQAGDYTTLSDLIQYNFQSALTIFDNAFMSVSPCTAYEGERKTVQ